MPPRPREVPFTNIAEEVETTCPEALVESTAFGVPEMVRLVVEAVPKKPSPEALKTEVEAPPLKVCNCDQALAEVRRLLPETRQVPLTEKQPASRLTPVAKVEVALVMEVVADPFDMESAVVEALPKVASPVKKEAPEALRLVVEAPALKDWSALKVLAVVVEKDVEKTPVALLYASG